MFGNYYFVVALIVLLMLWIVSTKDNENVLIKRFVWKYKVFLNATLFLFISKEKKGLGPKKNPDPDEIKGKEKGKRTIVFIRHGESDWNNIFNKGINIGMLVRFIQGVMTELNLLSSANSCFIDSPLNYEGIEQALELRRYVEKSYETVPPSDPTFPVLSALSGKNPELAASSIVATSSLRRAVATTTLALFPRIERTGEKIHVLSSLQEISRNPDTYALSDAGTIADVPFDRLAPHCGGMTGKFEPNNVFDLSQNFGNKSTSFYGIKRLKSFAAWAMGRPENIIIVGGHSLWFKTFFQTYLPHGCDHEAKRLKITNSGVMAFTLYEGTADDGEPRYRIEPESLKTIFGGFTSK